MKKMLFLLLVVALFFTNCKEQAIVIPPLSPSADTSHKVLIEEFTGVRCVNCPQGADEIASLQAKYGQNLISVAIHAGFFAPPYKDSQEDFRIPKGEQLQTFLGEPLGYPAAVINRKKFAGKESLQLGQADWAGIIQQELQKKAVLNIHLDNKLDASTQTLEISSNIVALENINEKLNISIMLSEDHIADYQLTPSGLNATYNHRHVLRAILTNFDGNTLATSLKKGEILTQTFKIAFSKQWKSKDCSIIAIVHDATNKEVLQVEEVKVK